MGDEMQRLFDMVGDLRRKANVNAAFGKPVAVEGRTIIPVARITYGFGLGFGIAGEGEEAEEEAAGGGGGGGAHAHPLAVIEVTQEGISVRAVVDEQKVALAGVILIGWIAFWIARTLMRIFGKR